jgi:hypothetical protein
MYKKPKFTPGAREDGRDAPIRRVQFPPTRSSVPLSRACRAGSRRMRPGLPAGCPALPRDRGLPCLTRRSPASKTPAASSPAATQTHLRAMRRQSPSRRPGARGRRGRGNSRRRREARWGPVRRVLCRPRRLCLTAGAGLSAQGAESPSGGIRRSRCGTRSSGRTRSGGCSRPRSFTSARRCIGTSFAGTLRASRRGGPVFAGRWRTRWAASTVPARASLSQTRRRTGRAMGCGERQELELQH